MQHEETRRNKKSFEKYEKEKELDEIVDFIGDLEIGGNKSLECLSKSDELFVEAEIITYEAGLDENCSNADLCSNLNISDFSVYQDEDVIEDNSL